MVKRLRLSLDERKRLVLTAFQKEFPTLEYAKQDLSRLSYAALKEMAKVTPSHWYTQSVSVFKSPSGDSGRWYADILPILMVESGWFKTIEEARVFTKDVRTFVFAEKIVHSADQRRSFTKDEVVEEFKAEFKSIDYVRANPSKLSSSSVFNSAKGTSKSWLQTARAYFRAPNRGRGNWHNDVLPNLLVLSGWMANLDEAKAFSKEIRYSAVFVSKQTSAQAEIVKAFKKEFRSLKKARKNLKNLSSKAVYNSAKGVKGHWYIQSLSAFRPPNQKGGNGLWYTDILPALAFRARWFDTLEKAKVFSEEVRSFCAAEAKKHAHDASISYTKNEVIQAFKNEFVSIKRVKKDLTKLTFNEVCRKNASTAGWAQSARNQFKSPNDKIGNWYADVLPNLLVEARWIKTLDEAKALSNDVKKLGFSSSIHSKRSARAQEVIEAFKQEFGSFERARENLADFGYASVDRKASGISGHWFIVSQNVYKRAPNKLGRWYADILPNLLVGAGWIKTLDDALAFADQVKEHVKHSFNEQRVANLKSKKSLINQANGKSIILQNRSMSVPQPKNLALPSCVVLHFERDDTSQIQIVMSHEWKEPSPSEIPNSSQKQKPLIYQIIDRYFGENQTVVAERNIQPSIHRSSVGDSFIIKSNYPLDDLFQSGLIQSGFQIVESNLKFKTGIKEYDKLLYSHYISKIERIEEPLLKPDPLYFQNHLYPERIMLNYAGFFSRMTSQAPSLDAVYTCINASFKWFERIEKEHILDASVYNRVLDQYQSSIMKIGSKKVAQFYRDQDTLSSDMLSKHKQFVNLLMKKEALFIQTVEKAKQRTLLRR